MAITYVWNFPTFRVKIEQGDLKDVVYLVDWTCTADNAEGVVMQSYGQALVPTPDPENFTPFEELTKEQVQTWVETALGPVFVESMQAALAQGIELAIHPIEAVLPAPWVQPANEFVQ